MSQADLEKAYTEAVDQLARAVEANRLLTERLEAQELRHARATAIAAVYDDYASDDCTSGWTQYSGNYPIDCIHEMRDAAAKVDRVADTSHTEEPPARPGAP